MCFYTPKIYPFHPLTTSARWRNTHKWYSREQFALVQRSENKIGENFVSKIILDQNLNSNNRTLIPPAQFIYIWRTLSILSWSDKNLTSMLHNHRYIIQTIDLVCNSYENWKDPPSSSNNFIAMFTNPHYWYFFIEKVRTISPVIKNIKNDGKSFEKEFDFLLPFYTILSSVKEDS